MKTPEDFPKSYVEAARLKDAAAYAALFSERVRIFDMWDVWEMRGRAACLEMAGEWFKAVGDEKIVVEFHEGELSETEDVAIYSAFVRFDAHDAAGTRLRFMDERMTVTMKREEDGEWRVTHQHNSAPHDPKSMMGKLQRT